MKVKRVSRTSFTPLEPGDFEAVLTPASDCGNKSAPWPQIGNHLHTNLGTKQVESCLFDLNLQPLAPFAIIMVLHVSTSLPGAPSSTAGATSSSAGLGAELGEEPDRLLLEEVLAWTTLTASNPSAAEVTSGQEVVEEMVAEMATQGEGAPSVVTVCIVRRARTFTQLTAQLHPN